MAHSSDMVMHIGDTLGENRRQIVAEVIASMKGVLQARFNERRPHLMLVSYDRQQVSSFDILTSMSRQNLCAERIG